MILDRVNPVTRIVGAVLVSVPLLATLDWVSATVASVGEIALFALAGYGLVGVLRRIWPLLLVAPIGALSMLLYGDPEGHEYWSWGWMHITENSVRLAIAVFVRVFALAIPAMLLFGRVDPTDLADGLAQLARLPERFVLGTLAGVRTVGLFMHDWKMLSLARRARGLGDRGVLRRAFTMAFALLVFALRRGTKLATAMEARGFGAGRRTWARTSRVGAADVWFLIICVALMVASLGVAIATGWFHFVGS